MQSIGHLETLVAIQRAAETGGHVEVRIAPTGETQVFVERDERDLIDDDSDPWDEPEEDNEDSLA